MAALRCSESYSGESDDLFDSLDDNSAPVNIENDRNTLHRISWPIQQSPRDIICAADDDNGWERVDSSPVNAPFSAVPGFKVDVPDDATPLFFFDLLFDAGMWDLLVEQTNLYADHLIRDADLSAHSRLRAWTPVTVDELKVFFALLIAMGLTRKTDLADYWSTDEVVETPLFGKHMSKNRFFAILSNLHLCDNETAVPHGQHGYDPLYKLRPFIRMLDIFSDVYGANECLSFDEATCPFKGRVSFRVYNPMKPNKFGIKLYQVCEAESGYCIGLDIYHGDSNCIMYCDAVDLHPDCSRTTKIVIGLLAQCGLLDKGHKVFLDNYYNSPELAEELDYYNTYICGTLRTNRQGVPKALRMVKNMRAGEAIFRRQGNLLVLKYHDKRDVHMISTFHKATLAPTGKRNLDGTPIIKPVCITEYCQYMGGVDLSDQIVQYYDVLRKTVKWWKKLFFHLFNLLLVNSFILYRKWNGEDDKRLHIKFRMSLIRQLLQESDAPRPSMIRGRRWLADPVMRLRPGKHFPCYIPAAEGAKRKRPLRDCIACNAKAKDRTGYSRKQTSFMCEMCEVALCVPDCFAAYHNYRNFKAHLQNRAHPPQEE